MLTFSRLDDFVGYSVHPKDYARFGFVKGFLALGGQPGGKLASIATKHCLNRHEAP